MDIGKLNILNETYQKYISHQNVLTISQLKEIAGKCELIHYEYTKKWLSPNHNLEIYLFEYYTKKENYNCTEYKLHEIYRTIATRYYDANDNINALHAYDDSLKWNPLDLDTRFEKARLYRSMNELEEYKKLVEDSYPFCYTQSDMARYYRYLGYYYLETYQPELAEALYIYSNRYFISDMAEQEIIFLKKAMGKNTSVNDSNEIQEFITRAGIPLLPKKNTLALLFETAKAELNSNNLDYAKYLFLFYYQLTGDNDTKKILDNLQQVRN